MKIERNGPGLEALERALRDFAALAAEVGIREGKAYPDGTPIAYVAAVQEFGHAPSAIPPRSFFRTTIADKRNEWGDNLARGVKPVIAGRLSAAQVLEQVGLVAAADIRQKITTIYDPPLSQRTLDARRKKAGGAEPSTKPLVDSGQLLQAIDSAVVKR